MATCREEFRCASFGLGGTKASLFVTPQARWLGMPYTFILYRAAIAIYQLTFLILTLVLWGVEPFYRPVDSKAKWLIFVSNWTYLFVTAYFILAIVTSIYWHCTRRGRGDQVAGNEVAIPDSNDNTRLEPQSEESGTPSTPWYFKVQRYLQVYACSASVFVTILYWVLEFDPATDSVQVFSLHVHGVAAFLMIMDTLLVATPIRLLHMIYVMITAFVYFCFTAVYNAAGGTNPSGESHIYSGFLDWGKAPGTSAIVGALTVFVAAPVIHLVFYALYRLRLAFGLCCVACKYPDAEVHNGAATGGLKV
ncbi:protein rolling stone-like [Diadema setosum]|uniref:protein rolling stone-like n=1 Tax=Diadema setosum TaxID=31175 RepID=UPI003B3B3DD4